MLRSYRTSWFVSLMLLAQFLRHFWSKFHVHRPIAGIWSETSHHKFNKLIVNNNIYTHSSTLLNSTPLHTTRPCPALDPHSSHLHRSSWTRRGLRSSSAAPRRERALLMIRCSRPALNSRHGPRPSRLMGSSCMTFRTSPVGRHLRGHFPSEKLWTRPNMHLYFPAFAGSSAWCTNAL